VRCSGGERIAVAHAARLMRRAACRPSCIRVDLHEHGPTLVTTVTSSRSVRAVRYAERLILREVGVEVWYPVPILELVPHVGGFLHRLVFD
jgi:hypothetical protein